MTASVLIADRPPESDRLRAFIKSEGYDVDLVTSTAEVVTQLRRKQPQLVLTELHARGIDGWDVMKATKALAPDAHIVFLLGSINDETEDILRRLDIDGHLLKPVDRSRLQIVLRALLHPTSLDRTTEAYLFLPREQVATAVESAMTEAGIFSESFRDPRLMSVEVKNDPPHLVIADIGPSCPDGFQVCEEVRQLRHYVPILAISERATREDVERAARLLINDLILEPLEPNDLRDSALRLLRHTKPSR